MVNHLGIAWQATPIGAIDPEDFYDFQVNRPVIEIEGGHTQRLIWPTTRISLARAHPADESVPPTGLARDVVLVHGIEPNMRWRAFSEELVQGLETLGVELIILLGASASSAPSRMTSSTPKLSRPRTSSSLNARQRMFGSMPCTRITSRESPVGGTDPSAG